MSFPLHERIVTWSTESAIAPGICERLPAEGGCLRDKRVLITGAGGSIGSALVRTLQLCRPAGLILVEQSEGALFALKRSLDGLREQVPATLLLGNFGEPQILEAIFRRHRPQVVFHAAAYKHVPLLEWNPFVAVSNNLLQTQALVKTAIGYGLEEFVLVSTDKAVDPTSVMGATKRMSELLLLALAGSATRLSAVRLGNVWASDGSVIPIFRECLQQGLPLVVTHPLASRFFLSMTEAVTALICALTPRANGTILLAELGPPTLLVDIARALIEMHGSPLEIEFCGLRAGEKLTESLLGRDEAVMARPPEDHSPLHVVEGPLPSLGELDGALERLRQAVAVQDLNALLGTLQRCIPRYTPSEVLMRGLSQRQEALQ